MAKLFLIRNKAVWDGWDYYEEKTEVLVFGDVEGYQIFARELTRAKASRANIHLTLADKSPKSMHAVILPASKKGSNAPRLKFIERFVHFNRRPRMELVIFGNRKGYQYFSRILTKLAQAKNADLTEHVHLDDLHGPQVVARSIALNIRAPLQQLTRKSSGHYADLIYKRDEYVLPHDVLFRLEPKADYQEIAQGESEFLTL